MINDSKSAEKFIKKNTNQLRLKLQNKDSKAETKFAKLLAKSNRRYVCAYSQSECELRVLKAFC